MLTLDDVLKLSNAELWEIVQRGAPVDMDDVADHAYTGIDLSLPAWMHKLLWKSFRKTFHRDPVSGRVRGWNVKVEQVGWDTPPPPKRDRKGRPIAFGHYELRPADGLKFPRGWSGGHYLDYGVAGNLLRDFPGWAGYCPIVPINPGNMDLLLGWEVFKLGPVFVPLNDYWVLRREGPLAPEDIVPRPDGRTPAALP